MSEATRTWIWLTAVSLITTVVGLVVFRAVFDGTADISGRWDVHRYFGPMHHFMDRAIALGDFPSWNPLLLAGMPSACNPQTSTLYPLNILRSLMLGSSVTPSATNASLVVLMGLHMVILGVGTAMLVRAHKGSWWGAMLAAIACVWSALLVRRLAEYEMLYTMVWTPWIWVLGRRVLVGVSEFSGRPTSRISSALALGLVYGLAILGGHPHFYMYMGVSLLVYLLAIRLIETGVRSREARAQLVTEGKRDALLGALAVAITVAIGAAMLLPALELLALTPRAAGGLTASGNVSEPVTPAYIWKTLSLYGSHVWEKEGMRGAGALAFALTLAGVFLGRLRQTLPLIVIVYAMIDLSIGHWMPLSILFYKTAPFQMVSLTRAFDMAIPAVTALSALGLDALVRLRHRPEKDTEAEHENENTEDIAPGWWRRGHKIRVALTALSSLGVLATVLGMTGQGYWLRGHHFALVAAVTAVGFVLLLVLALKPSFSRVLVPLIVLAVAAEIMVWSGPFVIRMIRVPGFDKQWVAASGYDGSEPFWPDNQRSAWDNGNFHLYGLKAAVGGYDPVHLWHVRNVTASERYAKRYRRSLKAEAAFQRNLRGALFLKRQLWLVPEVVVGPLPSSGTMFPPTTTAYVPSAEGVEGLTVEASAVRRLPFSSNRTKTALEPPKARRPSKNRQKEMIHGWDLGEIKASGKHSVLEVKVRPHGRAWMMVHHKGQGWRRWDPGPRQTIRPAKKKPPNKNPARKDAPNKDAPNKDALNKDAPNKDAPNKDAAVEEAVVLYFPLRDYFPLQLRLEAVVPKGSKAPELLSVVLVEDLADQDDQIVIEQRLPDSLSLVVDAGERDQVLVLLDAWYEGWSVTVDGEPARLLKTMDAFKGVRVPAGKHKIRFQFSSSRLHAGVAVSSLTALACFLAIGVLTRRRREDESSTSTRPPTSSSGEL